MANTTFNVTDGQNVSVDATKLIVSPTSDTSAACRAFDARFTGKYYFEMSEAGTVGAGDFFGIASPGAQMGPAPSALASTTDMSSTAVLGAALFKTGSMYVNGTLFATGPAHTNGVIGFAVDLDNKKLWAISGGTVYPSGGDPATNTGGWDISAIVGCGIYPCCGMTSGVTNGASITANFTGTFTNTVPSGFTSGWPANDTDTQFDPAACGFEEFTVSGSSKSFTLKTTDKNRMVGFLFYTEKGSNAAASTISTVTDTSGLSWNKRTQFGYNDGNGGNIEFWWAKAPNALNTTVTVTLGAATDHGVIWHFGLVLLDTSTGSFFYGAGLSGGGGLLPNNPFDANASLPATAHGASTTPAVTGVSTTLPKSLVLAICGDPVASEGSTDTANGFAGLGGFNSHAGGVDWADVWVQAKYTSAALSAVTVSGGTISSSDWGMLVDAISVSGLPGVIRNMAVVIG